jgi:hypothetical protein
VRRAGTKTSSSTTSLLSVPRIPSDRQVSTTSASLVRTTATMALSPTTAVTSSQSASLTVLASGRRPASR